MEQSSISTIQSSYRENEKMEMLNMVLARITHFNVRLKPNKCFFGMRSGEFLGRIFDEYGINLSEK